MDQNTKRDRAQKLKRDKRSKDIKRAHEHPNKSDPKPGCVMAPQVVLTSAKRKDDTVGKSVVHEEIVVDAKDGTQFANLKRETDEISVINKSFSKRQITSNWTKYETPLPPDDDDNCTSQGANFESLLGAPISEGGHFKFKSEQMWAPNSLQYNDLFSLNVKRLSKSLSCIPFYDQVSLPRELFSQEEIQQMDNEAKSNSDRLKTSTEEPLIDNFYTILKSSLVDSPPKDAVDMKLDRLTQGVERIGLPVESGGTIELYGYDRIAEVQPTRNLQPFKETYESSMLDDPTISPTSVNEERVHSNDDITIKPAPSVSLPQRSPKSKPMDAHKNNQFLPTPSIPIENAPSEVNQLLSDSKDGCVSTTLDEDDELDFLLTLKEPVSGPTFAGQASSSPSGVPVVNDLLDNNVIASSLLSSTEKKEDLEDWLDSILED